MLSLTTFLRSPQQHHVSRHPLVLKERERMEECELRIRRTEFSEFCLDPQTFSMTMISETCIRLLATTTLPRDTKTAKVIVLKKIGGRPSSWLAGSRKTERGSRINYLLGWVCSIAVSWPPCLWSASSSHHRVLSASSRQWQSSGERRESQTLVR